MNTNNSSKVKILLEDDNEVLGSGLGHTMNRQYLPTLKYIDILKKYNAKSTFYIDIAHLLFLKRNRDYKDFGVQIQTIENLIGYIIKSEMEVQLHIHSQWVNAEVRNNQVYVSEKWNIGQLSKEEQLKLVDDCLLELKQIKDSFSDTIPVNSFKAGSWGLQPFDVLYDKFKEKGLKIVMGPIKGLKVDALDIDYTNLESDSIPYYCNKEDINYIGKNKDITVIPMTPTYLNWPDFIRYIFQIKIKSIFQRKVEEIDISNPPAEITSLKPLANKDKLNISLTPFCTHLKINAQPFWYLKNTFKRSYKAVKCMDNPYKIMVIETHTKDFKNTFKDIDKFFNYLNTNFHDIEFVTTSQVINDIENGVLNPLIKN
ncbi:hypothetical protein KO504_12520 [Winogradskyella psychrotolerans]|uniref:hypothetical protein n=1 Tax=Winogradskyella psychrotolerans TaxID=1344585 RepID=UPI001C076AF2|nr:hypothetical protein [Winogradskyella psychrotolerans]MBU2922169.1 hypothetical protein [Winogradskyella psychrotolerans]